VSVPRNHEVDSGSVGHIENDVGVMREENADGVITRGLFQLVDGRTVGAVPLDATDRYAAVFNIHADDFVDQQPHSRALEDSLQ